jgi:hypothetical protein
VSGMLQQARAFEIPEEQPPVLEPFGERRESP